MGHAIDDEREAALWHLNQAIEILFEAGLAEPGANAVAAAIEVVSTAGRQVPPQEQTPS
jgi:hypothetical protein